MKEFIDKLIERLEEEKKEYSRMASQMIRIGNDEIHCHYERMFVAMCNAIDIVNKLAEENNMGEISDGYHAFNELYHHRAVLFSVICNSNKEKAWKSKLHDTGDMYEGMFIVGIETPEGQTTYHYDINPYWDMFKVKELPKAPKWDGHSPDEAIRRLSLLSEEFATDINVGTKVSEIPTGSEDYCEWRLIDYDANVYDTTCRNPHILLEGSPTDNSYEFCPYCGKKIKVAPYTEGE